MSFHAADFARMQIAAGAAWRKYQRLMEEAVGAMHDSPAMLAKTKFEHEWQHDPEACEAQALAEEEPAKPKEKVESKHPSRHHK